MTPLIAKTMHPEICIHNNIADRFRKFSIMEEAVSNPFESGDGSYIVLVNTEGQHSLWPAWINVPTGWSVAHGADNRQACIDYVSSNWIDMRPKSLIDSTNVFADQINPNTTRESSE
jgi:MbtH protein